MQLCSPPRTSPPLTGDEPALVASTGTCRYISARRSALLRSFGLVLYEMSTGRPALTGATRATVWCMILHEAPPAPCAILASLEDLVPKALERRNGSAGAGHTSMDHTGNRSPAVRAALVGDAVAIVNLHYAAVHRTAASSYPPEVLEHWSSRPGETRYQQMREVILTGDELVLVAENASGVIAFGSIVPRLQELRAVYVHPDAGRLGIGSQVLAALEHLARERGVHQLHMDASVNAESFYVRAGYEVIERAVHRLRTGQDMACVRMKKELGGRP